MRELLTTLSILFIATAGYAETYTDGRCHGEARASFEDGGTLYRIVGGNACAVGPGGKLRFVLSIYDPDFLTKNFQVVDGQVMRRSKGGKLLLTLKRFRADFEGAQSVQDLIDETPGAWHAMTLLSPRIPSVAAYNRQQRCLLERTCDFLDNRIDVSSKVVHSGRGALRTYAVGATRQVKPTKASLSTKLLYFGKGEDVWFSAWYLLEQLRMLNIRWDGHRLGVACLYNCDIIK